VLGWSTRS